MFHALRVIALSLAMTAASVPLASGISTDVVVHASMREPALQRNAVKAIFFGAVTRWDTGRPIIVFVLPADHPTTKNFAWNVLRVTPYSFEERISTMVATRDGNAPRVLETETEMLRAVSSTPNSIGYLSSFVVINNANSSLRVMPIL